VRIYKDCVKRCHTSGIGANNRRVSFLRLSCCSVGFLFFTGHVIKCRVSAAVSCPRLHDRLYLYERRRLPGGVSCWHAPMEVESGLVGSVGADPAKNRWLPWQSEGSDSRATSAGEFAGMIQMDVSRPG